MSDWSYWEYLNFIGIACSLVIGLWYHYDGIKNKELREILRAYRKNRRNAGPKTAAKVVLEMMGATSLIGRVMGPISVVINSSLALSMDLIAQRSLTEKNEAKRSSTVVGMMLGEKIKHSTRIQMILFSMLAVNALTSYVNDVEMSFFVILVVFVGFASIYIDHKLIEYRVSRGWYGKNEFESREIIRFILSHADKNDFNDQGGLKKVIPVPSMDPANNSDVSVVGGVRV